MLIYHLCIFYDEVSVKAFGSLIFLIVDIYIYQYLNIYIHIYVFFL